MSSGRITREASEANAARQSRVASGPLGIAAALLVAIVLSVMMAAVVTDGLSGPVLLHQVRQHLTAVGIGVAGFGLVAVWLGLRGTASLAGAVVASALVLSGMLGNVHVIEQLAQPGSERRVLLVQAPGQVLDGGRCVIVQSGAALWSWQEKVMCRSDDVLEESVSGAQWVAPDRIRTTFGDGSSSDHVVQP